MTSRMFWANQWKDSPPGGVLGKVLTVLEEHSLKKGQSLEATRLDFEDASRTAHQELMQALGMLADSCSQEALVSRNETRTAWEAADAFLRVSKEAEGAPVDATGGPAPQTREARPLQPSAPPAGGQDPQRVQAPIGV